MGRRIIILQLTSGLCGTMAHAISLTKKLKTNCYEKKLLQNFNACCSGWWFDVRSSQFVHVITDDGMPISALIRSVSVGVSQ